MAGEPCARRSHRPTYPPAGCPSRTRGRGTVPPLSPFASLSTSRGEFHQIRDLSHYETFEHYHATFYKHVEALSVTPFAPGAISRGLTALLVSCVRQQGTEFNGNDRAQRLDRQHPCVQAAVELIARRAHLVGSVAAVEQQVRAELQERLDAWLAEAQKTAGGRVLAYDEKKDGVTVGLLRRAAGPAV